MQEERAKKGEAWELGSKGAKGPISAGGFRPRAGATLFTMRNSMDLWGGVNKRLSYEPTLLRTVWLCSVATQ